MFSPARVFSAPLLLVLLLAPGATACAETSADDGTIRVLAASSLTDVFRDMKHAFESRRPGSRVIIAAAGSQILRLQIEQGLRADVFASANQEHMRSLVRAGLARPSRVFARNKLIIALPRNRARKLTDFRYLPRAARIVAAARRVPAGAYTETMLRRADAELGGGFRRRVLARVVSRELNVRLVLTRVVLGEADAGIVYASDVRGRPVRTIAVPEKFNVSAEYHIALLPGAGETGRHWIRFILSDAGRALLRAHGFQSP